MKAHSATIKTIPPKRLAEFAPTALWSRCSMFKILTSHANNSRLLLCTGVITPYVDTVVGNRFSPTLLGSQGRGGTGFSKKTKTLSVGRGICPWDRSRIVRRMMRRISVGDGRRVLPHSLLRTSGAPQCVRPQIGLCSTSISIVTNSRGPTRHIREVYFWSGMKRLGGLLRFWGLDKKFESLVVR